MLHSLVNTLFGCAHSRTTFPMTPGRRNGVVTTKSATHLGTYVVCLDCGKEFAYDWRTMRVGHPIAMQVTAAPVVAMQPAVQQQEAQPVYR
jgi:predicted transcriptional regulator